MALALTAIPKADLQDVDRTDSLKAPARMAVSKAFSERSDVDSAPVHLAKELRTNSSRLGFCLSTIESCGSHEGK